MRYKDKISTEESVRDKNRAGITTTTLPNPEQYTWYGLVNAPTIPSQNAWMDEIFDFQRIPNSQSFVVTMRWPEADRTKSEFVTFYYDKTSNKLKKIFLVGVRDDSGGKYYVPLINRISKDGKNVAFHMADCWNCGAHQPETILYNLMTDKLQHIGKTIFFEWAQNGSYSYKEYKEIPCNLPTDGPVPCWEDANKMPLLTGSF